MSSDITVWHSVGMYFYGIHLIPLILFAISLILSKSMIKDSEKLSEYECGFEPFDHATRHPFDVHFFIVGILFLIFDVEIALIVPWVLGLNLFGWFGFLVMLTFLLIITVGFIYEWRIGALQWPSAGANLFFWNPLHNIDDSAYGFMNIFTSLHFYVILLGILVIIIKNPIHSLLLLISLFFISAGILITIHAGFLAMLFLVIYIGAISILFLFVIMMFNLYKIESTAMPQPYLVSLYVSLFLIFPKFFNLANQSRIFFFLEQNFDKSNLPKHMTWIDTEAPATFFWDFSMIEKLDILNFSGLLYDSNALLLILLAYVLLTAMVGAIVLAMALMSPKINNVTFGVLLMLPPGQPVTNSTGLNYSTALVTLSLGGALTYVSWKLMKKTWDYEKLKAVNLQVRQSNSNYILENSQLRGEISQLQADLSISAIAPLRRAIAEGLRSQYYAMEHARLYLTESQMYRMYRDYPLSRSGNPDFVPIGEQVFAMLNNPSANEGNIRHLLFWRRTVEGMGRRHSLPDRLDPGTDTSFVNFSEIQNTSAVIQSWFWGFFAFSLTVIIVIACLVLLLLIVRLFTNSISSFYQQKINTRVEDISHLEVDINFGAVKNWIWDFIIFSPEVIIAVACLLLLLLIAKLSANLNSSFYQQKQISNEIFIWSTYYIILILVIDFLITGLFHSNFDILNIASRICSKDNYLDMDLFTVGIQGLISLTTIVIMWSATRYIWMHRFVLFEYGLFYLLFFLFICFLIKSYGLALFFLTIIGFSLTMYIFILLDKFNPLALDAGAKYFVLSALSGGLIAGGGVLAGYELYKCINLDGMFLKNDSFGDHQYLWIFCFSILVGLTFKIGAAPGHLWLANVYNGSSNVTVALFAIPVKLATFVVFLNLLSTLFYEHSYLWISLIWGSSCISMLWGGLGALSATKLKTFIAYSSINQMGFMLMGPVCQTTFSSIASVFYLIIYIMMQITFLYLFININKNWLTIKSKALIHLTDLTQYSQKNPISAFVIVLILFSMAGIPPLFGFFSKYFLFVIAFEQGFYSLVIVAMIASLISSLYYLNIINIMFFNNIIFYTKY